MPSCKIFDQEADLYDDTIELVAPLYRHAHQCLMQALSFHWDGPMLWPTASAGVYDPVVTQSTFAPKGWVLDIGSGTGFETLSLLRRYPEIRVVALDASSKMMEAFDREYSSACASEPSLVGRAVTLVAEIERIEHEPDLLLGLTGGESFAAAVSAFAFHHIADKATAYNCVANLLASGGIFVNADLFEFAGPTFSEWARHHDNAWIRKQFDAPGPEFERARSIPQNRREASRDRWLRHYEEDNDLAPIESGSEGKQDADDVIGQSRMLLKAGFSEAACIFRYWQMGVLAAIK